MESIIYSRTEITYKIARSIAVLVGDDKLRAKIIFENLRKIYNLRSTIVHGSDYNYENVIDYLPYLRSIASRMIIEIVLQNIQDINELNEKLTFAGFGDRRSLSSEYVEMTLNITSYVDSFKKTLRK